MGAVRKLPPEVLARAREMREQGASYLTIAKALGHHKGTIWHALHWYVVTAPAPRVPIEDCQRMREEYEADPTLTTEAMATRWGWDAATICRSIRRAGGALRPPGRRRVAPMPDAEMLVLHNYGLTAREIGALHGVRTGTVYSVLSRARRAQRAD